MKQGSARFAIVLSLAAGLAAAVEPLSSDPVVVTGTRLGSSLSAFSSKVTVIFPGSAAASPLASVPGLLSGVAGADIASRAPFGVQSEVGLRGADYQQTLVMVDGIRMNDPQTGHHNMDLPVPPGAIERIEVLHGPGSSAHGADALGGAVNIMTRHPAETPLSISVGAGSHGTAGGTLSAGTSLGPVGQSLALSLARSDGFRPDRDFGMATASSRTEVAGLGGLLGLTLGITDKDFGAFDFYTPGRGYPSRERTRTLYSGFSAKARAGGMDLSANAGYREHLDRFILDRTRPAFYSNEHTTKIYEGGLSASGHPAEWLGLAAGGEWGGDRILSKRLGNHWRQRAGGFGEARLSPPGPISAEAGLRYDRVGGNEAWSPSGGLNYWLIRSLRLRTHYGKSFRVPTYTELYYKDPVNSSDPGLSPEKSDSYEAGLDWYPGLGEGSEFSLTVFNRRQTGTIDWTGPTSKGPWKAVNSDPVVFWGSETSLKCGVAGTELSAGFRWTTSTGFSDGYSKYALNYPTTAYVMGASRRFPAGFSGRMGYEHRDRKNGDTADLVDLRLGWEKGPMEVFVEGTNLLDDRYEDIPGIPQPGAEVFGGITFSR